LVNCNGNAHAHAERQMRQHIDVFMYFILEDTIYWVWVKEQRMKCVVTVDTA